jgi:hypothetical protein
MALQTLDLWSLVQDRPQIDPNDLADAIVTQAAEETLDYRTRMLIRDSIEALRHFWGAKKLETWLAHCPFKERVTLICQEKFDKIGFPSLKRRIMDKTKPERVRQFFELVGQQLHHPVLIWPGVLSRRTEDIDVVGEVPEVIRKNHDLTNQLEKTFGLHFGHVQTHYFPMGWQNRAHFLDRFGDLLVSLLDVYDVFLSKLFSARLKDKEDMLVLAPQLDKADLIEHLKTTASSFLAAPRLLEIAKGNWQILYGETLPQ